jgi:hypothetical protein
MLFLKDGTLCFDIGWVGFKCGSTVLNDGQPHTVGLQHVGADYGGYVDGNIEWTWSFNNKDNPAGGHSFHSKFTRFPGGVARERCQLRFIATVTL